MHLKKYIRYVVVACLAMLPLIAAEYSGQVKFNNLPLPGATVTATQADKKMTAISDERGVFTFPNLPDGTWQLQVDMLGFTSAKQDANPGNGLPGPNFELKMLPMDQIEATAAAPEAAAPAPAAGTPAQTTTAAPAAAPKPSIVAANTPPANGKKGAAPPPQATSFQRTSLNGAGGAQAGPPEPAPEVSSDLNKAAADGMLVNGSAQNGASSPFAQNPAFGNNRRNGPRFYTYSINLNESNSALNARPFSLTGQDTVKPPSNQLTGGFTFQGPLYIPHLVQKRNQVSLNFSYQRVENRTSNVASALMPTDAQRAGNFSQATTPSGAPVQIFDPNTNQPFANNIIPVSRLSPQALALLKFYPEANFGASSVYNYQIPTINNTHTDNFQARVSKSFKRKNFVSGVYAASDTRSDNNSALNFLDLNRSLGMQTTATYRRTFTPRFFGTFTYQFSRQSVQGIPFFSNVTNVSGAAGITGNYQNPLDWGPPTLSFGNSAISQLSDANASIIHNQTNAYNYEATWSHGRHNIRFGGDFRWQQFNTIGQSNPRGTFVFTGAATQQVSTVNGVSTPVTGTGYDFADFLLGIPDQSKIAFGNADKYLRAKSPDLYFTDDWKVTPGFSVTLAFRWEYTSPITEKYGRLVNLDVAPGYTAIAPVVATNPTGPLTNMTYPSSLVQPDHHEFRPLPGFAWRPFPASSMVIRGGYGISYNTQVYNAFANLMAQQSPLSKTLQAVNSTATPLTLANGFYAPPNVTTNTIALDPNFKIGYAQVWNLSVQRDLPFSLVMQATYTGTKGTHELQAFVPNSYPVGATNPCPNCPSSYTYYTSNGNQTRQAGTLQLRRRMHNGFTASLIYTYAKSIDDAATLGGGTGAPAQNWLNLEGERGRSSFDQRHNAQISLQYTSGMGAGGGTLLTGWRGKLMKDWTFLDNINLGTGLPLTPTYSGTLGGVSVSSLRGSYTGADIYAATPGHVLNPAAVTTPVAGQWGNAGIDSITGPAQFSMNASMQRSFRLSDRFTLSLTINANNPLNHVIFTGWNTLITSPQFGTISAANQMRSVTTNMRLTF
jgi:hypothetical protein